MNSYIVIVGPDPSASASIGKLNYDSTRYEVVASGKYSAIKSLVEALNATVTVPTDAPALPSDAVDPATVAKIIAETLRGKGRA